MMINPRHYISVFSNFGYKNTPVPNEIETRGIFISICEREAQANFTVLF